MRLYYTTDCFHLQYILEAAQSAQHKAYIKKTLKDFLPLNFGIMAGGDILHVQFFGPLHQLTELNMTAAVDTGVGGFSFGITRGETLHDITAKFCGKLKNIMLDAKLGCHTPSTLLLVFSRGHLKLCGAFPEGKQTLCTAYNAFFFFCFVTKSAKVI